MSSSGQIVGAVVGGVAGFFLGPAGSFAGVALGAQLGMMAGGLLDPPKGPTVTGPRLSDLTIQTSTYGAVIPRIYGTVALHGNVFWLENNKILEILVKKKSGGKGGSKTVTKTYYNYATFALGLCRGPIAGVKRIWISGHLYYDAGSSDAGTIKASNDAATGFTVHLGTDTQLPNSRMQATLGVDNTPAYRGLAYIVFYDLPLADYGEALAAAQVKVEVMQAATYADEVTIRGVPDGRWVGLDYRNGILWAVGGLGWLGYYYPPPKSSLIYSYDMGETWTSSFALPGKDWIGLASTKDRYLALEGYGSGRVASSVDLVNWTITDGPVGKWWMNVIVNDDTFLLFGKDKSVDQYYCYTTKDGISFSSFPFTPYSASFYTWAHGTHNGSVYAIAASNYGSHIVMTIGNDSGDWVATVVPDFLQIYGICTGKDNALVAVGTVSTIDPKTYTTTSIDNGITWGPPVVITGTNWGISNISWNGTLYMCMEVNAGKYYTSPDLVTWRSHDAAAWYGLYWSPPIWDGAYWYNIKPVVDDAGHLARMRIDVLVPGDGPTLDSVVNAECRLSQILGSGDIDTSALTDHVRGYTIGSVGSLRNSIVPLQASWPFDVVQRGYKIVFVPRGQNSIAPILYADLDARSDSTEAKPLITAPREMDTQLPRKFIIKYMDPNREYDIGEQYAERLNTAAVNEETQDLPIVLTPGEAARKAEVLLYLRWMERTDLSFTLPGSYNHIEAADVVTLQTPEGDFDVRVVSANYTSDGRVEIKAKYGRAAVYSPSSITVDTVVSGVTTLPSPTASTKYMLLDVPRMNSVQDTPSILATMSGPSGWPGGVLIRTDDNGTTWVDVQGFDSPGGTVGTTGTPLGVVDSRVWDKASVLTVTLSNGTLASVTEAAVLNGANYFAYGAYDRWEIIAAQTCTLVSANTYTVTNLLRGRFGTEWAMGTHAVGDKFIALSEADVTAIGMSSSSIGLARTYRGITYGQDISTDTDLNFTYKGVNLECLSPVYLSGYKSPTSGDWILSWIRRSRTDGEWRNYVDAGLGESTEAYETDICSDGTYATVKRTLTSTTPTCTYTVANQVTDFGSVQSTIYAKTYQLSSVVGRGYSIAGSFLSGTISYFQYVVFQLNTLASLNSTTFTDIKGSTITKYGDAKFINADGLWGKSAYFDGYGDSLTLASTSDFNLGSGAMTIEFWLYRRAHTADARVLQFGPNGSATSCQCNFRSDGGVYFFPAVGSPASGFSAGAGSYPLDVWTHVAFVLTSTTAMRLYIDGVQKVNGTYNAFPSDNYSLSIGADSSMALWGHIQDLRITKGVARYTSAFTPPTNYNATGSSDPSWASVVLCMPFTSNLLDLTGKTVTVVGNTQLTIVRNPYSKAVGLDGTGDYLTVPTGTALAFGSGYFAIEMWIVRLIDMASGTYMLYSCWDGSTGLYLAVVNNNIVFRYNNGTDYTLTGPPITISSWNYVRVVKSGNFITLALSQLGGTTDRTIVSNTSVSMAVAGSVPTPTTDTYIGRASDGGTQYFNGKIGQIRVTKGAAPDLSNPPTLPLPTS